MLEIMKKITDTIIVPVGFKMFNSKSLVRWRFKREFRKPIEQFKLVRSDSYVNRKEFECGIQDAVLDDNCGVYVLWAPANFGKSCTARKVTLQLQNDDILTGAIGITCNETWKENESLQKWLYSRLSLPEEEYPKPLSDYIDSHQRILLIIDQFDKLMAHPRCEAFITSLAEDSVMRKTFTVMIMVTSDSHYNEILNWNGRQKIRPLFSISDITKMKWNEKEFLELLNKTTTVQQRKDRPYNRYILAWIKAGVPGFMLQTRFMRDIERIEDEANRLSHLWPDRE